MLHLLVFPNHSAFLEPVLAATFASVPLNLFLENKSNYWIKFQESDLSWILSFRSLTLKIFFWVFHSRINYFGTTFYWSFYSFNFEVCFSRRFFSEFASVKLVFSECVSPKSFVSEFVFPEHVYLVLVNIFSQSAFPEFVSPELVFLECFSLELVF